MTTTYSVKCHRVGIYLKGQCSMVILLAKFCTLKNSCAREHGISYWRICKKFYFLWKVDHFMLITNVIFLLKNVNCCPKFEIEFLLGKTLVCFSFIKFEDKKMVLEFSLTCTWTKFNKHVLIHIGIPLKEFICFVSVGVFGPQKTNWLCTNSLLDELGMSTYTSKWEKSSHWS